MMMIKQTKYLRDLRRTINEEVESAAIRVLVGDLGFNWAELDGETASEKLQNLISTLAQSGELESLTDLLHEEYPDKSWPVVPTSTQQRADERSLIPESAREATLQTFLRQMGELVVGRSTYDPNTIATAQAHTDAALNRLDPARVAIATRFLLDSQIIHQLTLNSRFMVGADLSDADLLGTDMRETNLEGANMRGINLSWANARRANFQAADLSYADLVGADLIASNLNQARLVEAGLMGVDLIEADLSNATLCRANLIGADLRDAILTDANFEGAYYNDTTLWPEGFDPVAHGLQFVDDLEVVSE